MIKVFQEKCNKCKQHNSMLEYKNKKPPNIGPIIVPIRKLDSNLANFLVRLDLSEISAI